MRSKWVFTQLCISYRLVSSAIGTFWKQLYGSYNLISQSDSCFSFVLISSTLCRFFCRCLLLPPSSTSDSSGYSKSPSHTDPSFHKTECMVTIMNDCVSALVCLSFCTLFCSVCSRMLVVQNNALCYSLKRKGSKLKQILLSKKWLRFEIFFQNPTPKSKGPFKLN